MAGRENTVRMSLARRWRSQEFKPSRGDLLLAALPVLVTASVLARTIYRDEPLTVLLIPAAVAAILCAADARGGTPGRGSRQRGVFVVFGSGDERRPGR